MNAMALAGHLFWQQHLRTNAECCLLYQTLPADLFNLSYSNQLSVDFSKTVIKQMQSKHPNLEWLVGDVRSLGLDDSSIDIAIDKASPH